jgi:hypothetical protein
VSLHGEYEPHDVRHRKDDRTGVHQGLHFAVVQRSVTTWAKLKQKKLKNVKLKQNKMMRNNTVLQG